MHRFMLAGVAVAALLMVGGMLLLGLPGGIYAELTAPVVELLRGLPQGSLLDNDRAWPTAILMALIVPPALPVSMWIIGWVRPQAHWLEGTAWVLGGMYLWALAVMFYASF
ncbi:MAG: hypothetical protein IR164_18790 [Devosia sp.]|jgi:Na+-translocating ferredoxin:NAD+ oxidoreductase RnfD subunit|uniref:hypothetical protein n=1 Tax=unclassified Devosia TaxID=196773 RepID=UPI0019EEF5D2|nr:MULTISPECIES: hypothetical protein [unclassified Devosia]MBF0680979.1 hypothetical protein [Devosia sp.]WEJ32640.1 hypothetical protein NYQ88_17395 [Devosia sp. SD17-2]